MATEGNGCQLQQTHVSTLKKKNILTELFLVKLYLKRVTVIK